MDEIYDVAFELILSAGNSKSNSMMAIEACREFRFEDADKMIKEAQKELNKAHLVQTEMIQKEAQGTPFQLNLVLVHAQDHLTMALMSLENAKEMKYLYQTIEKIIK